MIFSPVYLCLSTTLWILFLVSSFADNLFPEPGSSSKDPATRPFGAKYNIPTTTDNMNNFTFEAIARLGNDEPLQRVIHEVITTDNSLPIRSGSDLMVTLGNNSSLLAGISRRSMKKTNAKKDILRRTLLRSTSHQVSSRAAVRASEASTLVTRRRKVRENLDGVHVASSHSTELAMPAHPLCPFARPKSFQKETSLYGHDGEIRPYYRRQHLF